MKKTLLFVALLSCVTVMAQEVEKNIASARSSYDAGKLEDARYAMEQALKEIDMAIGKEMIALLPAKLGTFQAVAGSDAIHTAGSGLGLMLGRQYGVEEKGVKLDIASNSPLVGSLNALLSLPIAGLGNPDQKQVKVQGYKALLTKSTGDNGKTGYDLQVPFGSTVMTMHGNDVTEADILAFANAVPLAKIAALAQ